MCVPHSPTPHFPLTVGQFRRRHLYLPPSLLPPSLSLPIVHIINLIFPLPFQASIGHLPPLFASHLVSLRFINSKIPLIINLLQNILRLSMQMCHMVTLVHTLSHSRNKWEKCCQINCLSVKQFSDYKSHQISHNKNSLLSLLYTPSVPFSAYIPLSQRVNFPHVRWNWARFVLPLSLSLIALLSGGTFALLF